MERNTRLDRAGAPARDLWSQPNKKAGSFLIRLFEFGAGNETRTRDPDLGKVVLYQLSYSRNVLLAGPEMTIFSAYAL